MDASVIYDSVYRHFHNYEYKLLNSFVYNWESDFFAISKSGYAVEVEVKVSRSDFFRDFEKREKHLLFSDRKAKRTHHIHRNAGYRYADEQYRLICEVEIPHVSFQYGGSAGRNYRGWRWSVVNGKSGYWVNDYGRFSISRLKEKILAPCTSIKIRPISEILCPHSFYYACPYGLIEVDEIPDYAGLIYVREGRAIVIKKAPFLHKESQDLTKVLLQKFYNLWKYKVDLKEKLELSQIK